MAKSFTKFNSISLRNLFLVLKALSSINSISIAACFSEVIIANISSYGNSTNIEISSSDYGVDTGIKYYWNFDNATIFESFKKLSLVIVLDKQSDRDNYLLLDLLKITGGLNSIYKSN